MTHFELIDVDTIYSGISHVYFALIIASSVIVYFIALINRRLATIERSLNIGGLDEDIEELSDVEDLNGDTPNESECNDPKPHYEIVSPTYNLQVAELVNERKTLSNDEEFMQCIGICRLPIEEVHEDNEPASSDTTHPSNDGFIQAHPLNETQPRPNYTYAHTSRSGGYVSMEGLRHRGNKTTHANDTNIPPIVQGHVNISEIVNMHNIPQFNKNE